MRTKRWKGERNEGNLLLEKRRKSQAGTVGELFSAICIPADWKWSLGCESQDEKTWLKLETCPSVVLNEMILSSHLRDTCFNSALQTKALNIFYPSATPLGARRVVNTCSPSEVEMRHRLAFEIFPITCRVFAWSHPSAHSFPLVASEGHFHSSNQDLVGSLWLGRPQDQTPFCNKTKGHIRVFFSLS